MSRNSEYQFVTTDTEKLVALLVSMYEKITAISIHPSSPERLFIQWITNVIIQERVLSNYIGNQNIPSRAEGENLDALAELYRANRRPEAKAAICTERFSISSPQTTAILIPCGTRVTGTGGGLVWETVEDAYVPIGETYVDVPLQCQTVGTIGNGYAIGQLNRVVDIYLYYSKCENITASDGGADMASDEEFYELMRASMDGYSCAGARGSYIYFAKQVSTEIADVIANSPTPGVIKLYVLMKGGELATEEVKAKVLAACNADEVRPLTDQVFVEDAETVSYDVEFTYYTQKDSSKSTVEIQAAVEAVVDQYNSWQCAKLGRDINPSYLHGLLMQTGIKRVVPAAPAFTVLRDGGNGTVPQVAKLGTIMITNGGYEDE